MDTLKSLMIFESSKEIERWIFAVEDPKDSTKTRIFRCKKRKRKERDILNSNKRGGNWKFKAFRFVEEIEEIEVRERSISDIWNDIPKECFRQIPIKELKKLKEWTD